MSFSNNNIDKNNNDSDIMNSSSSDSSFDSFYYSFNTEHDFINDVEIVRKPDEIICEKLISNDFYNNSYNHYSYNEENYDMCDDDDYKKAIEMSLHDSREQEDNQVNNIINETIVRTSKFESIKNKFKKIIKYDKFINEIYSLIEWIIEYYCTLQIDNYKYDRETYDKIFNVKLLKSIRLDENEIELLREIIRL